MRGGFPTSLARFGLNSTHYHAPPVLLFYSLLYFIFFSPAILRSTLLAVGVDAQNLYLPNYYARKVCWDILIFGGFPLMADPQVMTWYPPAFLLSLLPGTWNLFVLFPFIAASSLTYGYVYRLTGSRVAGLFSGIIYGMSGFMMAHLGHAVVIQSAAWIPLIIWSLEELRRKVSAGWMIAGSIGIAMSFLGGHSQIFAYGLLLSIAYAVTTGWSAPIRRWRYYLIAALVGVLGIGLAGVQILPTAELAGLSARVGYSFADFTVYALPPRQALMIIFPKLFGGLAESGVTPYFGGENLTELTGYVGLLPLALAGVGVLKWKQKPVRLFWLCAGLLSFLLAMGNATPLARMTYHLPVLSQFRAPGRHLIELTFAVSVLSGLGIAALLQQSVSTCLVRKIVLVSSLVMAIAGIIILTMSASFVQWAAQKGIELNLLHWTKEAIGVPLFIFVLAMAALTYWHKAPASVWRNIFIFSIVIIDLGSFGWFYQWHYSTIDESFLKPTETAERYKNLLTPTNQRMLSTQGALGSISELPPNLSKFWGIPSAGGYNSLILSRLNRLLSMTDVGDVKALRWRDPHDQSLSLLAVRYVFTPQNELSDDEQGISWLKDGEQLSIPRADVMTNEHGTSWFKRDMDIALGSGCNKPKRDSLTFYLPAPVRSTGIAIVTALACSPQVTDGTEVARVRITEADGNSQVQSLVAGKDTSEWAYECGSVRPMMKHRRASIFSTYPATVGGKPCEGHFYVTRLDLKGIKNITSIELNWIENSGSIAIEKLSLTNHLTNSSMPIDPVLAESEWRFNEETKGAYVYENLRAMPRTWLVPEVISLSSDEALSAIKTSRLTDGRAFDSRRTALTEEPIALPVQNVDKEAWAAVMAVSDTEMEVRTSSKISNFLVTSDVYYPGWQARIDGRETSLYRANYALRGVVVPPGDHIVRFEYRPRSFQLGALVSLLSLLTLGAISIGSVFFRSST